MLFNPMFINPKGIINSEKVKSEAGFVYIVYLLGYAFLVSSCWYGFYLSNYKREELNSWTKGLAYFISLSFITFIGITAVRIYLARLVFKVA
jgi:hypothetical protein